MSVANMLKGHELFQSLDFKEVEKISEFSELKAYEENETVFESGRRGTHFFVLQQGGVTLRLPSETHEVTLIVGRIGNGEAFGLSPILGPGHYTTTAVSTEASRILAIEAKPLQLLLEENCLIGLRIMQVLAEAYFSRYIDALARVQRVVNEIGAH